MGPQNKIAHKNPHQLVRIATHLSQSKISNKSEVKSVPIGAGFFAVFILRTCCRSDPCERTLIGIPYKATTAVVSFTLQNSFRGFPEGIFFLRGSPLVKMLSSYG